jgi:hypothetical protein
MVLLWSEPSSSSASSAFVSILVTRGRCDRDLYHAARVLREEGKATIVSKSGTPVQLARVIKIKLFDASRFG